MKDLQEYVIESSSRLNRYIKWLGVTLATVTRVTTIQLITIHVDKFKAMLRYPYYVWV
ncbi:hypothetical protein MKW92_038598, partial [Papaver armeniacum]